MWWRTCWSFRRFKRVISNCLKKTEPASGCSIPKINRRMVLLPLPLCPMITSRSSGSTASETPSSTLLSSNCFLTSRSSTMCELFVLISGKVDVDDVVQRIDTDHDGDGRDDTRRCRCANPSRSAFHGQTTITRDRCDQQSEQEAFEHARYDVANEQCVANKIEKVRKGDAGIRFRNQASGGDRGNV